jgi:hypothetical protein
LASGYTAELCVTNEDQSSLADVRGTVATGPVIWAKFNDGSMGLISNGNHPEQSNRTIRIRGKTVLSENKQEETQK